MGLSHPIPPLATALPPGFTPVEIDARSATNTPRFTQAEKDAIVAKHNEGRGMVSPPAANMKTMVWDDELANMARRWSKDCYYGHGHLRDHSVFGSPGQNLHIIWSDSQGFAPDMPNGVEATQHWYDEHKDYNYDNNRCKPNALCGHYTQNVWASTYAVGCGRAFCPLAIGSTGKIYRNAWLVTCNYGPSGNVVGQRPYETGPACSKCDSEAGFCKDNLCNL
nr:cysteine-rich secretory protein LCCL domain-containing 2-like [Lytechinus pictus]